MKYLFLFLLGVLSSVVEARQTNFIRQESSGLGYIITGTDYTPPRFAGLKNTIKSPKLHSSKTDSYIHVVSSGNIGLTFLPNLEGKSNRNLGSNIEFQITNNSEVIRSWLALSNLKENKDIPKTLYAGNFRLDVNDTLLITLRTVRTKEVAMNITVFRAEDKANNFVYYEVPLKGEQFSSNLQNILNISSEPIQVYRGDSTILFEKDPSSIGLIRFLGVGKDEKIEYSFEDKPYHWRTLSSINSENGIFLVLDNRMEANEDQDIYLRYASQPETIHKITIRVKEITFAMPWGKIAVVSIILLIGACLVFYFWNRLNKRKLKSLRQKSKNLETDLELLSGQLNPHFLFNSLNAIQSSINSGQPEKVKAYIGNVASFMRTIMDNGRKEFISLEEELKIEDDYLNLEKERRDFKYSITLSDELKSLPIDVPPLLLQPILENSIRHAFTHDHPDPKLSLIIVREGKNLILKLADNGGIPWDTDKVAFGQGLMLTKKRIDVYNEKLDGMFIQLDICYLDRVGTITMFTFHNWLA